jgi:hypothetical protein
VKEEGKKVGNTERRSLLIVDSRARESRAFEQFSM